MFFFFDIWIIAFRTTYRQILRLRLQIIKFRLKLWRIVFLSLSIFISLRWFWWLLRVMVFFLIFTMFFARWILTVFVATWPISPVMLVMFVVFMLVTTLVMVLGWFAVIISAFFFVSVLFALPATMFFSISAWWTSKTLAGILVKLLTWAALIIGRWFMVLLHFRNASNWF